MKKTFAALGLGMTALFSTAAFADDATPQDVFNLLLVTGAIIDFCKLTVDKSVQDKVIAQVQSYQKQLNVSDDDLTADAKKAADTVAAQNPDCSESGDVVKSTRQFLDLVNSQ